MFFARGCGQEPGFFAHQLVKVFKLLQRSGGSSCACLFQFCFFAFSFAFEAFLLFRGSSKVLLTFLFRGRTCARADWAASPSWIISSSHRNNSPLSMESLASDRSRLAETRPDCLVGRRAL